MRKYYCMNPIAQVGLDNFSKNYIKTDEITGLRRNFGNC